MAPVTIGLLHPGEMGSVVGQAVRGGGARVMWTGEGRTAQTRARAAAADFEDAGSLGALVAASDVILSVCPPAAAVDVARAVAAQRFAGLYLDGNAVSPATARDIAKVVEGAGATFVDGGIVGPPPKNAGTTRLFLSGKGAARVAQLFEKTPVDAVVVDGPPGAASAVKMCYASWTKGTSALIMAIRALAIAEGVDEALLAEWGRSHPELPARAEQAVRGSAKKAWRFVGEMEEIAATFEEAGLPGGFHLAAGEIYKRLERYKDAAKPPSMADVAATINEKRRAQ